LRENPFLLIAAKRDLEKLAEAVEEGSYVESATEYIAKLFAYIVFGRNHVEDYFFSTGRWRTSDMFEFKRGWCWSCVEPNQTKDDE